ncbi:uncharacterized protein BDZ99DRAFT_520727 [Mytilinidion resinicola]|uniref:Uncharacterized protein n=1 Tax=Mytilinidion resinicola TaxID=574789 RepID=A0A6A6YLF1_9PEZI|nr:uncharacterized protein BDZ99DRAFT_520727 [Mytilinidion resinicola]KAF2809369.1 hypothetical protein BDZ99DRAFT_520727 [Mytilinidion resinicola]
MAKADTTNELIEALEGRVDGLFEGEEFSNLVSGIVTSMGFTSSTAETSVEAPIGDKPDDAEIEKNGHQNDEQVGTEVKPSGRNPFAQTISVPPQGGFFSTGAKASKTTSVLKPSATTFTPRSPAFTFGVPSPGSKPISTAGIFNPFSSQPTTPTTRTGNLDSPKSEFFGGTKPVIGNAHQAGNIFGHLVKPVQSDTETSSESEESSVSSDGKPEALGSGLSSMKKPDTKPSSERGVTSGKKKPNRPDSVDRSQSKQSNGSQPPKNKVQDRKPTIIEDQKIEGLEMTDKMRAAQEKLARARAIEKAQDQAHKKQGGMGVSKYSTTPKTTTAIPPTNPTSSAGGEPTGQDEEVIEGMDDFTQEELDDLHLHDPDRYYRLIGQRREVMKADNKKDLEQHGGIVNGRKRIEAYEGKIEFPKAGRQGYCTNGGECKLVSKGCPNRHCEDYCGVDKDGKKYKEAKDCQDMLCVKYHPGKDGHILRDAAQRRAASQSAAQNTTQPGSKPPSDGNSTSSGMITTLSTGKSWVDQMDDDAEIEREQAAKLQAVKVQAAKNQSSPRPPQPAPAPTTRPTPNGSSNARAFRAPDAKGFWEVAAGSSKFKKTGKPPRRR